MNEDQVVFTVSICSLVGWSLGTWCPITISNPIGWLSFMFVGLAVVTATTTAWILIYGKRR